MKGNKKVLYFEGAGWEEVDSSKETIGNCRIRTAFTNNKEKQIYLEMGTAPIYNKKKLERYAIHIDHLFYITGNRDDCNINQIPFNYQNVRNNYNYSTEDITKWINENLDCSFDTIIALPDLAGYRVHKKDNCYNLADTFNYDVKLTAKRKEIREYFYNLEKVGGKKYPNFSLWVDEDNQNILHLLRHFEGHNRHWEINTDITNWIDNIKETKLNKYGC